ncbi:MAG: hypothetical protein ACW9XH_02150 [Candidatus Nitrosopumilus sp. bin_32a]
MKTLFLLSLALLFVVTPVYGDLLSDATGLVNRLDVQTGGHTFEVQTTANFDIPNFEFDKDEKKLTLHITSGLKNNLGEVILPKNLLGGNLTFYLNDQEYFPQIKTNDRISFVTLNFTGSGDNKLDIIGTAYLSGLTEITPTPAAIPDVVISESYDEVIYVSIIVAILIIVGVFVVILKKRK